MEIIFDEDEPDVLFGELCAKDLFSFEGEIYMKSDDTGAFNSFCFDSGNFHSFTNLARVTRLEGTLTVRKK